MPGVPFSKACELCKKRRVKCDELKPSCSQCLRIGKPCPGYRPNTKFVDEGPRLQARARGGGGHASSSRRSSPGEGSSAAAAASVPSALTAAGPLAIGLTIRSLSPTDSLAASQRGFQLLRLSHLPVVHCGRLHSVLDYSVDSGALARMLEKGEEVPSYVSYLPQRLGRSPALDSALDCVMSAAGLLAAEWVSERQQVGLLRKYGTALGCLREAIEDAEQSMSAEVLAAVSLLSAYECLQSSQLTGWINHQQGIYQLVEKRGPERYTTDFERQLLIAAMGSIFTIALRNNHPCFLESPEWQRIITSPAADSILANEWSDSWAVLPTMCLVPRLITDCRFLIHHQLSNKLPEAHFANKIAAVATAATELRHKLLNLSERHGWGAGRYFPVLAPRDPVDQFRLFCDRDDQRAANFANYLSALMIVNRILLAVRPSMQWLEQKNRKYALEIQYMHSYIKSQDQLREIYLVHSERVALAVLLTSGYWSGGREVENCSAAHDPDLADGGRLIDEWKWDAFDDILCAKKIDAPLMFHYDGGREMGSGSGKRGEVPNVWA